MKTNILLLLLISLLPQTTIYAEVYPKLTNNFSKVINSKLLENELKNFLRQTHAPSDYETPSVMVHHPLRVKHLYTITTPNQEKDRHSFNEAKISTTGRFIAVQEKEAFYVVRSDHTTSSWSSSPEETSTYLFDTINGQLLHTFNSNAKYFQFAKADHILITHDWQNCINIFDTQSGKLLRSVVLENASKILCYSPDGKFVAFTAEADFSMDPENNDFIFIQNLEDSSTEAVFIGIKESKSVAAFSPDNKYFAATYPKNNSIQLRELATGTMQTIFITNTPPNNIPEHILFSPSGTMLAASYYQGASVWNTQQKKLLLQFTNTNMFGFKHSQFSSDERLLITHISSNSLLVHDIETARLITQTNNRSYKRTIFASCYDKTSNTLLGIGIEYPYKDLPIHLRLLDKVHPPLVIKIWDAQTGQLLLKGKQHHRGRHRVSPEISAIPQTNKFALIDSYETEVYQAFTESLLTPIEAAIYESFLRSGLKSVRTKKGTFGWHIINQINSRIPADPPLIPTK